MLKTLTHKSIAATSIALAVLGLVVTTVSAQTVIDLGGTQVSIGGNFGFNDVNSTISTVVQLILGGAAIAAFVFIVWGAFKYVIAGDDSSKTDAARKTITNAVIGLILVALSFVIWLFVFQLLGLDSTTSANPPGQCSQGGCLTPE